MRPSILFLFAYSVSATDFSIGDVSSGVSGASDYCVCECGGTGISVTSYPYTSLRFKSNTVLTASTGGATLQVNVDSNRCGVMLDGVDYCVLDNSGSCLTVVETGSGYIAGTVYTFTAPDNTVVRVTGPGAVFAVTGDALFVTQAASSGSQGDPHITFAHGGRADLRGRDGAYISMLSVPGFQFAARTSFTDFLLPRPQLVHGSFFTDVSFRFRGDSGRQYGVTSAACNVSFSVYDVTTSTPIRLTERVGVWQQWWEDGVRVYYKQATVYVRAHGWEVNATRKPVYNYISGPSRWRFDTTTRYLDGTPFERYHGRRSPTCFPHGIVGQSWDGDTVGINGRVDDYTYNETNPVVLTTANAEGAIEGSIDDYIVSHAFDTNFRFTRYDNDTSFICKPRDTRKLTGTRVRGMVADNALSVESA